MGLEWVCTVSGCASYNDGNDQNRADSCNDEYLGGCIVVEAAAAVHNALAVVLPHAGAVQRLVVSEVRIRDITCNSPHLPSYTCMNINLASHVNRKDRFAHTGQAGKELHQETRRAFLAYIKVSDWFRPDTGCHKFQPAARMQGSST